jgi:prepilin-type N-terminal cleavage/methylation domain-containing protein
MTVVFRPSARDARAFTLIELLVVVVLIGILASLLLPALAGAKASARRTRCVSNLKQVSLSLRLFAADQEGKYPWDVLAFDGGSADDTRQDTSSHFRVLSNELATVGALVCPSDKVKTLAHAWRTLANTNVSYFVALEADDSKPETMLAGDRNLSGPYNTTPCGVLGPLWTALGLLTPPLGTTIDLNSTWTRDLHNRVGNIGLSDGSVHQLSSEGLRRQTNESDPVNNNNHARTPE